MFRRLVLIGSISLAAIFGLTKICSATAITQGNLMAEAPGNSVVLDTGDVVFQFTAPYGETDGMAWDGTNLWVGCDGLDRIWKYDTLGTLLDSIPAPASTATGLTWDGTYLWCADGGTFFIYKLDPATGNVIDSIAAPGSGTSCEGLAWMNDTLWNTNWANTDIWMLDPATGTIWGQFPAPSTGSTGLTWDWHDNCLWNSDQSSVLIYKLDPVTGAVITSFASPDAAPQDLAFDGTYLWICGWNSGIVYKMDIGYVGVEEHESSQPVSTILQISPNPFRDKTDIRYQITDNSKIDLQIFDVNGRLVRQFDYITIRLSDHISWDGRDNSGEKVSSGVYLVKLTTEESTETQKLLLIR